MFCKNCGKEILDDSKYCRFCGANQIIVSECKMEERKMSGKGLQKIAKTTGEICGKGVEELASTFMVDGITRVIKGTEKNRENILHKVLVSLGLEQETFGEKIGKNFRNRRNMKKRRKR